MDNQHRKTKGYRELSQAEIDLMNRIKEQGPVLEQLVKDIDQYLAAQALVAYDQENYSGYVEESQRIDAAQPCLWMEEGRVSLQKGLMYLTRSVAQPAFF